MRTTKTLAMEVLLNLTPLQEQTAGVKKFGLQLIAQISLSLLRETKVLQAQTAAVHYCARKILSEETEYKPIAIFSDN